MITDTSAEARKVDKKTAMAMWDNAVLPPAGRKRRTESEDDTGDEDEDQPRTMSFTLVTKRGNKQQVSPLHVVFSACPADSASKTRAIAVPSEVPLAVQTRSAQLQDKEEQQHLKRLVLDYEQREEAEERKGQSTRPVGQSIVSNNVSYSTREPRTIRRHEDPLRWLATCVTTNQHLPAHCHSAQLGSATD
jgi:regulator of nonsense transcripts 2